MATAQDIYSKIAALPTLVLQAMGNVSTEEAQSLSLTKGDLIWAALTGGDGQSFPGGLGSEWKRLDQRIAEIACVQVDELAEEARELQDIAFLAAANVVDCEGAAWDWAHPECNGVGNDRCWWGGEEHDFTKSCNAINK